MDPTVRYELRPGEWRPDPPHVSYGCDRTGLVSLLEAEYTAAPWTHGESDDGPTVTVHDRTLACPPSEEDIAWLENHSSAAPYGRGEDTIIDPEVRDAMQVDATHVELAGSSWEQLRTRMLEAARTEMGLADATVSLEPLKVLLYRRGGHFSTHADTEKCPGMVASVALILAGEYEGGALVIEHGEDNIRFGPDGSARWRWAAWYTDCRHRLEEVRDGIRIAMTFGIAIDPEQPLTRRESEDHALGWALYGRTFTEWHTKWAARGGRTAAGREQYGQKTVLVLSHHYTEPGLRASLLKGRDRELARLLVDEIEGEAAYLGWLQIREVGPATTEDGGSFGDHGPGSHEPDEDDAELPPPSLHENEWRWAYEDDYGITRIRHEETPELHLDGIARQNVWVEGLRSLGGESVEHGPIEVLDGEIVPQGALADVVPNGARLYEATGNEGAAIELQYRTAVLVAWRRNTETMRMLARCGGRLAASKYEHRMKDEIGTVLGLWHVAIETDGGGPAPDAHRVLLDALETRDEALHDRYVTEVTPFDLDAAAVEAFPGFFGVPVGLTKST